MATNFYFDHYENSMEQTLIEDLCIEAIQIHGVNLWYIPRRAGSFDEVYQEDAMSYYDTSFLIDMYIKNSSSGFAGKGDFLSGLGVEIRDSMTLVVARRTWQSEVGDFETYSRPNEGDLVYFPLNRKIFKISFVEHESIFYQVGALQVWELKVELFEYSGEVFDTGIPEIDVLTEKYNININGEGLLLESSSDGSRLDELGALLDEFNGLPLMQEDWVNQGEIDINALNDFYEESGESFIDFSTIDPFVAPGDRGTY